MTPVLPLKMMAAVWRQEDEALIERLEDEVLLERLWRHQAGAAPPPHPRAAGMISLVRRMSGGREATASALQGRFDALFSRLLPGRLSVQPPELLHHIALYYERLADALAVGPSPDASIEARIRSIAAWIALGEEQRYLRSLAAAITGGALPAEEADRAADEAAFEPIDALGRQAKEGAGELSRASWLALSVLARTGDACRLAGASQPITKAAVRRADRQRVAAADEALSPLLEALSEATARGDAQAKAPPLFARMAEIWRWAGEDESVEVFAVEQVIPIAWELQRHDRWDELRRLFAPLIPLAERLARRVEEDPTRIAYASACAQMYVFRYEMETSADIRLQYAERSVKICPTHRNGRLVLASSLCDQAVKVITPTGWYVAPDAYDRADALVRRAEQLFPALKQLESVKQRVAEARRIAGAVTR